jgi:hypothetical protein
MAVHEIEAVVRNVDPLGTAHIGAEAPVRLGLPQPARREVRQVARLRLALFNFMQKRHGVANGHVDHELG